MEDCLKPVLESVSADTLKKNNIRKAISTFFKVRQCHTLVRPVDDEETLANIEKLEWESPEIKEEFREQCDEFMQQLKQTCRVKTIHGKSFNGQMLLGLAMDFCEAVNSEDSPKIESSVTRLVQEETQVIQDEAYSQLQVAVDEEIGLDPIPEKQFTDVARRALQNAVRTLQCNLARFLSYEEIMEETHRFKQRIQQTGILKRREDSNYAQGFYYSQQLLEQLMADREEQLSLQ